jgi:hypothetical protein
MLLYSDLPSGLPVERMLISDLLTFAPRKNPLHSGNLALHRYHVTATTSLSHLFWKCKKNFHEILKPCKNRRESTFVVLARKKVLSLLFLYGASRDRGFAETEGHGLIAYSSGNSFVVPARKKVLSLLFLYGASRDRGFAETEGHGLIAYSSGNSFVVLARKKVLSLLFLYGASRDRGGWLIFYLAFAFFPINLFQFFLRNCHNT